MSSLGDNLTEVWANVKEEFNVEVVFVSTTNEGTVGEGVLQAVVADSNMLNQLSLLFASWGAVKGANDYILDSPRVLWFNQAPAHLKVGRDVNRKFRE